MKKMQTIIAVCVLFLGTALSGIAGAAGPPDHPKGMGRPFGHHGGGEPMQLTWAVQKNMMVQVLSQLTGQPANTIQEQLKEQRLPAVLDEYKIDRKAFHDAMRVKVSSLVKLLTDNGYLSKDQGDKILEEAQEHGQRREIMSSLIEKGLADGTITQQQAEMLKPHHR